MVYLLHKEYAMTDFEKIKQFFTTHQGRFVGYNVIDSDTVKSKGFPSDYLYKHILHNEDVKDFFALEFPFDSKTGLVDIDSLDSFVFDFYFVDLGDKIVIDDAGRTFLCGVEAYEGNGVIAKHSDVTEKYLAKNGLAYVNGYGIAKQTSTATFVQDAITFVKVLQTLNNAQPYPPYILELDDANEVVDVLTRCWVKGEKLTDGKSTKRVALFDNYKQMQKHRSCPQSSYPPFFKKLRCVGVFVNSNGQVLVKRKAKCNRKPYSFAIDDFVAKDDGNSLIALQRAVHDSFGFEFWWGEFAPKVTTNAGKEICDYFVVPCFDVELTQLQHSDKYLYQWVEKDELLTLLATNKFATHYSTTLIQYLLEQTK